MGSGGNSVGSQLDTEVAKACLRAYSDKVKADSKQKKQNLKNNAARLGAMNSKDTEGERKKGY